MPWKIGAVAVERKKDTQTDRNKERHTERKKEQGPRRMN
jgi:hypothetical protein